MRSLFVISTILCVFNAAISQDVPSCDSQIYCQGDLLHFVQMAQIFPDSKTFVDMNLVNSVDETLQDFHTLLSDTNQNPSKEELTNFVSNHFVDGNEFDEWTPPDYAENPDFIDKIPDQIVKQFAQDLVKIWPTLARKIKSEVSDDPDKFSLIPVDNGFIIPGGRFKEFYYWDSYWIVKGLLVSQMHDTVKGMLENFLSLVDRFGFIPNGARVYYLNRSQPPLLTAMIANYLEATNDVEWIRTNIEIIDKELRFWLDNRIVEVTKDEKTYNLAHYDSESGSPRPESYFEDYTTATYFDDDENKANIYKELKSGAESGVDFSSRWIVDETGGINGNLTSLHVRRIIPVDLNSYLCQAFRQIASFYEILEDNDKEAFWNQQSLDLQQAIAEVFYNQEDGIWYDWDRELSQHRKHFFPSNFAPLWTESFSREDGITLGDNAVSYFLNQGLMDFQGGIPSSLDNSGEQWDAPNAWPPHQAIVIQGLIKSGSWFAFDTGVRFAQRWVNANFIGYQKTGQMYEKYNAEVPGDRGQGGEYVVQAGFGWTNGVALEFINDFFTVEE